MEGGGLRRGGGVREQFVHESYKSFKGINLTVLGKKKIYIYIYIIYWWYSRSMLVAGRYGGQKRIGALSSSVRKYY